MVVPERKGMSLKERVQQCEAMEKYRIVFGKVGMPSEEGRLAASHEQSDAAARCWLQGSHNLQT